MYVQDTSPQPRGHKRSAVDVLVPGTTGHLRRSTVLAAQAHPNQVGIGVGMVYFMVAYIGLKTIECTCLHQNGK